jgi:hypothetical protein
MEMNILITESQERMLLNESIGREFGSILKQNSDVGNLEKLIAIEEYNYVMESSKYIANIESGGLYSDWSSNDF